jgi:hypothetical protein
MSVYYLLAGLLMFLLSIAHALWGERRIFNQLPTEAINDEFRMSLYVPWHQLTWVLFASGLGLILSAIGQELAFLPYFILAIVAGNLVTFFLICIVKRQTSLFAKTVPQTILFLILMVLIVLGILN